MELCDQIEADKKKYSTYLRLAKAYGLLEDKKRTAEGHTYHVIPPRKASRKELEVFHTSEYLTFCEKYSTVLKSVLEGVGSAKLCKSFLFSKEAQHLLKKYGLQEDCEPFADLWEYIQTVAGGSLKAADILKLGKATVVLHFFGGRHHASPNQSRGHCFVNDIVLAIQRLRQKNLRLPTKKITWISMERILYIDLDIHHGNGVMNAFRRLDEVFCLSFHHYAKGFYPNTGSPLEMGEGKGIMHNL